MSRTLNRFSGVLFVLVVGGCHAESRADPANHASADWLKSVETVRAMPVAPHWSDFVPARVGFDEAQTSRLGAPLAGRVTDVWVERGQSVIHGDKLFSVASADLTQLTADRDRARLALATARTALERTSALVTANAVPGKELVAARQAVAQAELDVQTGTAKLASLAVASGPGTFTVVAPRDGVVVEKSLAVGQQVSPADVSLLAIADLSAVWITADILDGAAVELQKGDRAQVEVDDANIDAVIDHVSAIVDPDRHTVPVRVTLPNAGGLRPNAHVRLRWFVARSQALALPATAVLDDGAASYVYARDNGKFHRVNVVASPPDLGVVAVRSGLNAGDEVVAKNAPLLDNQLDDR